MKPRAFRFLLVVSALVAAAWLGGCVSGSSNPSEASGRRTYWIEALPEWRAPADAATIDAGQLMAAVLELAPQATLLTSDATFTRVNADMVGELTDWSRNFLISVGRASRDGTRAAYVPESFDCDKFAKAFSLAFEMSAARAGVKVEPLVARIFVNQVEPFGGVPAGGGHALNAIVTDRGVIVVEPQSGATVPWDKYPNRTRVWRIAIGG